MTGPFGVEVINKAFRVPSSVKAKQVANQMQNVSSAGPRKQKPGTLASYAQAVGLARQMKGPIKAGDSIKSLNIRLAGTQARANARSRGEF